MAVKLEDVEFFTLTYTSDHFFSGGKHDESVCLRHLEPVLNSILEQRSRVRFKAEKTRCHESGKRTGMISSSLGRFGKCMDSVVWHVLVSTHSNYTRRIPVGFNGTDANIRCSFFRSRKQCIASPQTIATLCHLYNRKIPPSRGLMYTICNPSKYFYFSYLMRHY